MDFDTFHKLITEEEFWDPIIDVLSQNNIIKHLDLSSFNWIR